MIHKSVFGATGQAALRSGSNILTRGIAEGTGGAVQYNADLLARNIAFGEDNKLDFASDEARKQFMLSFAIGAVAEVPHAFGSFKGYKAGYSNLDMYQRAADGLWEYENNNKLTVEQLGKSGIIDDRTPETLVAQEIADSRMKSIGIEGAGKTWGTTDDLINSATTSGKGGVSPVGRAFQKHAGNPNRAGSFAGEVSGNAAKNTQQGANYLNNILNNPNSTYNVNKTTVFGDVLDVRLPDGTGARWSADGKTFIGFLEKYSNR